MLNEGIWVQNGAWSLCVFSPFTNHLYIYAGLPSPPMASGSINNHGSSGGDSSSGTLHPFAVDVGKQEGKQNHSIVAILVLSAVITSILCIGVVWILLLKYRTRSHLSQAPQCLRNSLTKEAGKILLEQFFSSADHVVLDILLGCFSVRYLLKDSSFYSRKYGVKSCKWLKFTGNSIVTLSLNIKIISNEPKIWEEALISSMCVCVALSDKSIILLAT